MKKRKGGKRRANNTAMTLIGLAFVLGLLALAANLFSSRISYTTSEENSSSTQSLYCSGTAITNEGFFDLSNAESAKQEIRATIDNNNIQSISYSLNAIYNTPEIAKTVGSELHAQYNLYMDSQSLDIGLLSPTFSVSNTKVKIGLYADGKKINNATAKLFFLNPDQLSNFSNVSLIDFYEKQKFTCNING